MHANDYDDDGDNMPRNTYYSPVRVVMSMLAAWHTVTASLRRQFAEAEA